MFYVAYRNDDHDSLFYATEKASDMATRLGISVSSLYCEVSRLRKGERPDRKIKVYAYTDKELED